MDLFVPEERAFAEAIDRLSYANPFSRERFELERLALGDQAEQHVPDQDPWQLGPNSHNQHLDLLRARARLLLERERCALPQASPLDQRLYASLVRFVVYYEVEPALSQFVEPMAVESSGSGRSTENGRAKRSLRASFESFDESIRHFLGRGELRQTLLPESAHLFAIAYQLVRAFGALKSSILGASPVSQRLRADVWNSVFTADRRRYERCLFDKMHEVSTLVIGPSGTGKDLVARVIGASRYLPFDPGEMVFTERIQGSFLPANLSAFSANLIESELFGHRRGAFSGAVLDRVGLLESCPAHGTLFLDEVGELSPELQVKLLRTLQSRTFQRVGENTERRFLGKLVSATNRDLDRALREGLMRDDFYYRICSDVIQTPSLASQIEQRPEDLELLAENIAKRILPETEVAALCREVLSVLERPDFVGYEWPGNVRELEQVVRGVLIRGAIPASRLTGAVAGDAQTSGPSGRAEEELRRALGTARLSADDLLDLYIELWFEKTRNYSQTARILGIDRRTVKARLER